MVGSRAAPLLRTWALCTASKSTWSGDQEQAQKLREVARLNLHVNRANKVQPCEVARLHLYVNRADKVQHPFDPTINTSAEGNDHTLA
jgi:hypothetical protein